eukprot:COSAG06_NODE_2309_length_7109_cov_5.256205_4_plen_868_part_01
MDGFENPVFDVEGARRANDDEQQPEAADGEDGEQLVSEAAAAEAERAAERAAARQGNKARDEMDDADHADNIREFFGQVRGLEGIGSLGAQAYLIVGFFSNFSLLTMVEIDWPSGWLAYFGWLKVLAFPFKIMLPMGLLVDDVAFGETLSLALALSLHPLLLAYVRYRSGFFSTTETKEQWAAAAEKSGWSLRAVMWFAAWFAPPVLFEAGRVALGVGDGVSTSARSASGSGHDSVDQEHVVSGYTAAWLFAVGVPVVSFLLHRTALRSAYRTSRNRNEPQVSFFGRWAYAEGSVLLFAYITLHLSVVVACMRLVALFVGGADGLDFVLSVVCVVTFWLSATAGYFLAVKLDDKYESRAPVWGTRATGTGIALVALVYGMFYLPSGFLGLLFGPPYTLGLPALLLHLLADKSYKSKPTNMQRALEKLGLMLRYVNRKDFFLHNPVEGRISHWIAQNGSGQPVEDRAKAIDDLVAKDVARGDENSMKAALFSLVAPFEQKFWQMKLVMMLEKVMLGGFVAGTEGAVQLWGSLSLSVLGTAFYLWKKPMLEMGEDLTECCSRASNTAIILTGSLAHRKLISKDVGEGILTAVSVMTMALFVVTIGPRRAVTVLTAFTRKQVALHHAAEMTEQFIKDEMTKDQVIVVDDTLFANLSADQQDWLVKYQGRALANSHITVVNIGSLSLPTKALHASTTLDASEVASVRDMYAMCLWMWTPASAAVADLNISDAIIGDAGAALVEAISASSSLELITIGKGVRLPLKDNYDSDVLDVAGKDIEAGCATVIAWWLATSAAAASVEVIKLDGNPIGTPVVSVKPGAVTGVDVKKGVFAALGERFGVVTEDPTDNGHELVKLRWLDDGSESDYINVD